jgi:hypothetical protein
MTGLPAHRFVVAIALIAVLFAACSSSASGTRTAPTPGPATVTTPAQAIARVIAAEPRFRGIQPFDTGLIGQASWYTVEPASGVGAFVVTIRVGWGDCQAGCIEEHGWVFAVRPDGTVVALSETGSPVPAGAWPEIDAGATGIQGLAVAGPVCPVETVPPDPDCAARPVAGAMIVIRDAGGSEVARVEAGADGSFFVALAAGDYTVEPQAVEGLLGTAELQAVTVVDGSAAAVELEYDTGIR